MAVSYFKSKDIKIFPATFRGNYSQTAGGEETITRVFDPEAKFNSEYNYTHLPGRVLNAKSIILDTNYFTLAANDSISITESESCYIHFVLDGYYFEISGAELFDILKKAKDLTLAIATRTTTIVEEGGIDNKRDLHYLTSYHYGDSVSLDSLMSIPGSMFSDYRCTAIAAETDEYKIPSCPGDDIIGTASHASREDSSKAILQIKASGEFCYKNFASNLVPAYCQNYAVYLNSNGAEPANLEVGYEASATESGAVAIGFGAKAKGKDVIAIGDYASAELIVQSDDIDGTAIALGSHATAANNSIVIGNKSETGEAVGNAVVVGQESITKRSGSVLIGKGIKDTSIKEGIIAVGEGAKVHADESKSEKQGAVAIGNSAEGKDVATVAVGPGSKALKPGAIALGADAEANTDFAISIGEGATSLADGDITIGRGINNPSSRTYQRTILGQYNDETKDGRFVIATGANISDKKTSCVFNAGNGTIIYENLTVNPGSKCFETNETKTSILSNLSVEKPAEFKDTVEIAKTLSVTGDTELESVEVNNKITSKYLEISEELQVNKTIKIKDNQISIDKAADIRFTGFNNNDLASIIMNVAHPVNSVFETFDETLNDPTAVQKYFLNLLGVYTTWEACAEGRVLIGADINSASKAYQLNATGGSTTCTLGIANMPSHTHEVSCDNHDVDHSHKLNGDEAITDYNGSHSHYIPPHSHQAIIDDRYRWYVFSGHKRADTSPLGSSPDDVNVPIWVEGNCTALANLTTGSGGAGYTQAGAIHQHTLKGSTTVVDITLTHKITETPKGGNQSFSLMQPYIVCYRWRRIS